MGGFYSEVALQRCLLFVLVRQYKIFIFIVGGFYSVTALRENDQERVTVYTKHRLKLHPQTTLTNDGGLKNLDTRRDGGRIGKIVLHVGGSAVALEGVPLYDDVWCLLFVLIRQGLRGEAGPQTHD